MYFAVLQTALVASLFPAKLQTFYMIVDSVCCGAIYATILAFIDFVNCS